MKVIHLNCATLCPFTGSTLVKKIPLLKKWVTPVCHCLLIETARDGLILIDTGLGVKDVTQKERFFTNLLFSNFAKPVLDISETAFHQVSNLGYSPKDVRHIIVSHLDADHVGGLADFPHAEVHVLKAEWEMGIHKRDLATITRYLPEQFNHGVHWQTYELTGEKWNGFEAVKKLKGITEDIFIVPLPGHTKGHLGVAIKHGNGELFFAGDAYLNRNQILSGGKPPAYVKLYNQVFQMDKDLFEKNIDALSKLRQSSPKVEIFCSHDHKEFECLSHGRSLDHY